MRYSADEQYIGKGCRKGTMKAMEEPARKSVPVTNWLCLPFLRLANFRHMQLVITMKAGFGPCNIGYTVWPNVQLALIEMYWCYAA